MNRSPFQPVRYWARPLVLVLALVIVAEACYLGWQVSHQVSDPATITTVTPTRQSTTGTPDVQAKVLASGLENPWDIAFLPNGDILFTEKTGSLNMLVNNQKQQIAQIPDVKNAGEGGLLGLAIDPAFDTNRRVYTCMNTTAGDIKVVRWALTADFGTLTERKNIITGIPANPSNRHSGCQLAFGPDKYLWVGTGDSAQGLTPQSPQDPKSLGGKILRVSIDGAPAPGNFSAPYDSRIYSFGHRNTQGIAFFKQAKGVVLGVSAEHGSTVDDELNPLKPGNFGWSPPDGTYDETNVPMTDKTRFPSAVDALWSSGDPTQAPSGVALLDSPKWKDWKGAAALGMLKGEHVKILLLDKNMKVTKEKRLMEHTYGRIRAATLGPDGFLYISTANGTDDKLVRLTPQ